MNTTSTELHASEPTADDADKNTNHEAGTNLTASRIQEACTAFLSAYRQLLTTHMPDRETACSVLAEKDHALFQELGSLFAEASKEQQQYVLDCVHEERFKYNIPNGCSRRLKPKLAERLQKKLVYGGRSSFADWIACRKEGEFASFPLLEAEFQERLGEDAALVWRNDYRKEPDVVQYGYAYLPGSLAIMEIQVIEPIAAWVFGSNSNNKHLGDTSYVTFKESSKLYSVLKEGIIKGEKPVDPIVDDVVAYYEAERRSRGEDPTTLNKAELKKLQALIVERFGSSGG